MTPTVEALARADNIIQQCRHTPLSGGLSTPGEQRACINCIASAFTPLSEALVQAQAFRCLGARCDHGKVMDCQEAFALVLTEQAREIKALREALKNLVARYVHLLESGDCGSWDAEDEPEVIEARAVLRALES